jgi:hypothetical protein
MDPLSVTTERCLDAVTKWIEDHEESQEEIETFAFDFGPGWCCEIQRHENQGVYSGFKVDWIPSPSPNSLLMTFF